MADPNKYDLFEHEKKKGNTRENIKTGGTHTASRNYNKEAAKAIKAFTNTHSFFSDDKPRKAPGSIWLIRLLRKSLWGERKSFRLE